MTLDCCLSLQAFVAVKGHFCEFLVSNIFLTYTFFGFSMPFLLVFCFLHYVLFFSISGNCFMLGLNRISVRSSFLGYPVIFSRFHLKFVCKIIFNVH